MSLSREQILAALSRVRVPKLDKSLTELELVRDVSLDGGAVSLLLGFTVPAYASKSQLRTWATEAVEALAGVETVEVAFAPSGQQGQEQQSAGQGQPAPGSRMIMLPQVGCVLAVFSGKGGVGKSTVSANLAVALSALGERVGLFDADLYGPSVPTLMGIKDRPRMVEGRILPLERHGVKTMSVGFLVDENEPLIWRGPMITKGINEMLESADWGALDFLVLDLPPGTGDAPLGLAQDVRMDGTVAVTTPQSVALADVHRGIAAFRKLEVPVWGIIENMAYFLCPHCGEQTEIFGHGAGERESEREGIPLLGRLPLDPTLNQSGDDGVPIVSAQPQHPASLEFKRIAAQITDLL